MNDPWVSSDMRVVVLEHQPLVAAGVVQCLVDNGFAVEATVADARAMIAAVSTTCPALVVADIGSAAREDVLAAIADVAADIPVLALTPDISLATLRAALAAGCAGVVPVFAPVEALVAAALVVAGGEQHVHPAALAVLVDGLHAAPQPVGAPRLSGRELGVLALVAEGMTNAAIGERLSISAATVKTHVEHVLHKLGAVDRANAVSRAMRLHVLS